jgi:hypothetical protein
VISRKLFDKKVKGALASDVERVVSAGEHLGKIVKARLPANLLLEDYFDVVEACQALTDRLDGEANQIIKTICEVSKVHKRRLWPAGMRSSVDNAHYRAMLKPMPGEFSLLAYELVCSYGRKPEQGRP